MHRHPGVMHRTCNDQTPSPPPAWEPVESANDRSPLAGVAVTPRRSHSDRGIGAQHQGLGEKQMLAKKVLLAAASCFTFGVAAAHEAIQHSGVLKLDMLACTHIEDTENLVNFTPTDQFPTSRSFLAAVQEMHRCVWWHKGDRVMMTVQAYYGAKHVVAAQRSPDTRYF